MRGPRAALIAIVVAAAAASARAGDGPEPVYADKPASWWVEELLEGDQPDAARGVLQKMGADAAPWVAARLATTRSSRNRRKLLGLLGAARKLPDSAVPFLRPCLTASEPDEQREALQVLRSVGPSGAPLAADAAALLESSDERVRSAACDALGAMGEAAARHVPALVAQLADATTFASAAAALGKIGKPSAAAIPALLDCAASRAPHAALVRTLAALGPGDRRVGAEIARAATSGNGAAKEAARDVVSQTLAPGDAFHAAATALASSEDVACRCAAARGLGRWAQAEREIPEELIRLLGDAAVALEAARALAPVAAAHGTIAPRVAALWMESATPIAFTEVLQALRPEIGPALFDAAVSERKPLRDSAWRVIQRTREGGLSADPKHLTRLLLDERIALEHRIGLLALLSGQQVVAREVVRDVFAAVAQEGAPELAARATSALSQDGTRRDALIAAAARPEPEVRLAAVHALGHLAERHDDVRAALVRALSDDVRDVEFASLNALQGARGQSWSQPSATRDALAARLAHYVDVDLDRRRAVMALLGVFPADARPAAALVALLAHDDFVEPVTDWMRWSGEGALPLLHDLAKGEDAVLAARATRVLLLRSPSDELIARLAAWIDSKDPRVARAGALAAAGLPPQSLTQLGGALIRAARGGVDGVALAACNALTRLAPTEPAARDALFAIADDPRHPASVGVTLSLVDSGPPGVARVVSLLDDPIRDARRNSCVLIADRSRNGRAAEFEAAVPALERLAAGDDLELARLAKDALALLRK